ncbi:PUA-like domain-containing protein [Lyophyllum atratum]|nr:PUA-like domain-containing protein [Lyophyllum atratum]
MNSANWLKGSRPSETPGRHDPRIHGEIPGYPVGSKFPNRDALSAAGVHAPLRAGIHGAAEYGAYSVVMSHGYEDDEDQGEIFIYTGEGGRVAKVSRMDKLRGKESWDTEQSKDQEFTRGNLSLKVSCANGKPVRVVRGAPQKGKMGSKYSPAEGYRYDGLYQVMKVSREMGKMGYMTCRFEFHVAKSVAPSRSNRK